MGVNVLTSATAAPFAGDGVYIFIQPPDPIAGNAIATDSTGIVGTASWGTPNTPVQITGPQTGGLFDAFGRGEVGTLPLLITTQMAFEKGQVFYIVRVTDGTDTAAQMNILDPTGVSTYAVLTAVSSGSRPNPVGGTSAAGTAAYAMLTSSSYSTTAAPMAKLTTFMPDGATEVFDQIPASNGAALKAGIVTAVNTGTKFRGPSTYWVATVGASLAAPTYLTTTTTFQVSTAGTDGGNVSSATAIGTGGFVPTGMNALRGTGISRFCIAECTDPTIIGQMAAFSDRQLCCNFAMLGGLGLTTTAALATKQNNNINDVTTYPMMDYVVANDPATGAEIEITPLGHAVGAASSLSPEQSLGNKPSSGFTTILSVVTPNGMALGSSEKQIRADNGIGYITNQMPRAGGLIGLAHGQNASNFPGSTSASTGLNYTSLTYFIARNIFAALGPFVDELQNVDPTDAFDPTRRAVVGSCSAFLQRLQDQNKISAFSVTADQSNNTSGTIASGYLNVYIRVVYLGTVRYIVPVIKGGTTVQLASATSVSAASSLANQLLAA